MNAVKVKREDLLTKVRANREAHRELFLRAQASYRNFVIEELDRMLADAKAGRRIRRSIDLVQPRDHTSDYDRVIMMLEMSVDDTIVLTAGEFDQYVCDVWSWSRYDATTLGEYAVSSPVYRPRKAKRDWDDDAEDED
jgi:hypothetical protein